MPDRDSDEIRFPFNQHDTPPPVLIAEGSLRVETTSPFGNSSPTGGGRKRHIVSDFRSLNLAHIKIVDGSGEMLYRNDRPRGAEVRVLVDDGSANGSEVKFGCVADGLYIDLTEEKDLGNPQNLGGGRHSIYRPKKNAMDLEITALKVAVTSDPNSPLLFQISKDDLNSHLIECRILVWLER